MYYITIVLLIASAIKGYYGVLATQAIADVLTGILAMILSYNQFYKNQMLISYKKSETAPSYLSNQFLVLLYAFVCNIRDETIKIV